VGEAEFGGEEHERAFGGLGLGAVEGVVEDGVIFFGEVGAELVFSSCLQGEAEERKDWDF